MALTTLPEMLPRTRDSHGEDPQKRHLKEYYARIGEWCDAADEESNANQNDIPELKGVTEQIDYLSGIQWKENQPSYKAKPVSNETLNMFWEIIGLLTDVKPMFHITQFGSNAEFSKTANILNLMAKGWATQMHFERELAFATMFGMMTSAPAKIYWNPFARGWAGDPSDGDITYEHLPVHSVKRLGINSIADNQQDECNIYDRTRTLAWIRRAYPTMGKYVEPEETVSRYTSSVGGLNVSPRFYPALSGGMRRLLGEDVQRTVESVYPRAKVTEFWLKCDDRNESRQVVWMGPEGQNWRYAVKPGQLLYPRGRVIIRSNKITLYDEPNPYFHRKFPFTFLHLWPVPWQQYAMSLIKPWMTQQDILNQIMAGLLNCIKKAVNPPFMAPKSAISPEAMRAIDSGKPNLKITYSQNAPTPPSFGQPPNVPAYVFQGYSEIKGSMRQMSAGTAMDQAGSKKQVPGSDTLDRMTFSRTTPVRFMGRNMEDHVDEVGSMFTANALQFYSAERRIEYLGAKEGLAPEDMDDNPGSLIPESVEAEAFVRRFKFKCDKGTLLNVVRNDRVQIGFALRKNHDLSRQGLYRLLDWNIDLKRNDEELGEEAKAMAMAAAAAGVQPGKGHHK